MVVAGIQRPVDVPGNVVARSLAQGSGGEAVARGLKSEKALFRMERVCRGELIDVGASL